MSHISYPGQFMPSLTGMNNLYFFHRGKKTNTKLRRKNGKVKPYPNSGLLLSQINQLQKFPVLITQSFTHMLSENAQLASSNNPNSGQHQPIPHFGNGRILPLGYIWPWTKKQLSLDLVRHFFRKIGFELRLAKLSGISLPGVSKIGMILFTSKGNKYKDQIS